MKPYTRTFSNGLKLVYIPHNVKSVTACLRGLAGSNYEKPEQIGAAHLIEHLSMQNAKESIYAKNILWKGGKFTGTTSRDDVAFFAKVLQDEYINALYYLYHCFTDLEFNSKEIKEVKSTILQEVYLNLENPLKHLYRISYKPMFPKQRMAKYNTGDIDDIHNISLEEIVNFKKSNYVPSKFVLSICGDIDWSTLNHSVENIFEGLKNLNNVSIKKQINHKIFNKYSTYIENRPDLSLSYLKVDFSGFRTSDKNKYASFLISYILKTRMKDMTDNYNLETLSFSSNTYGLFSLTAALKKNEIVDFLKILFISISRISKGIISKSELEYSKNKLVSEFEFNMEKTSLRADFFSELFLYKQVTVNYEQEIENYMLCTLRNIKESANLLFEQKPKITIIDKNITKKELDSYMRKSSIYFLMF